MCAKHANGERTAVERIAAFASKAKPAHLTAETRTLLKRNILDSVGCAIAALPGAPFRALRDQFEEYRSAGSCTLIGVGPTPPPLPPPSPPPPRPSHHLPLPLPHPPPLLP